MSFQLAADARPSRRAFSVTVKTELAKSQESAKRKTVQVYKLLRHELLMMQAMKWTPGGTWHPPSPQHPRTNTPPPRAN